MEYRESITSFTQLKAWQESHKLVLEIYEITKVFPKDEQFGLTNQIRRAAVSITSNIAEGFRRETYKDKIRFYFISLASLSELQNQLLLARDIKYLDKEKFMEIAKQSVIASKLIMGLIKSSKTKR